MEKELTKLLKCDIGIVLTNQQNEKMWQTIVPYAFIFSNSHQSAFDNLIQRQKKYLSKFPNSFVFVIFELDMIYYDWKECYELKIIISHLHPIDFGDLRLCCKAAWQWSKRFEISDKQFCKKSLLN